MFVNIFKRKREKFECSIEQVSNSNGATTNHTAQLTRVIPAANSWTSVEPKKTEGSVQLTKSNSICIEQPRNHPRTTSWQSQVKVQADVHPVTACSSEKQNDDRSNQITLATNSSNQNQNQPIPRYHKYHNALSASLQALSSSVQPQSLVSRTESHCVAANRTVRPAESSSSSASSIDTLSNANLSRKFTDSQISLTSAATHQNTAGMHNSRAAVSNETLECNQTTAVSQPATPDRCSAGALFGGKPGANANHVSFVGSSASAGAAKSRIIKAHSLYNLPHDQSAGVNASLGGNAQRLDVPGGMLKQSNSMLLRLIAGAQSLSALDSNADSAAALSTGLTLGSAIITLSGDHLLDSDADVQQNSLRNTDMALLQGEISQVQRRIERIKRELETSRSKIFQQRLDRERIRLAHAASPSATLDQSPQSMGFSEDAAHQGVLPDSTAAAGQRDGDGEGDSEGDESYLERVEQLRAQLKSYQFSAIQAPPAVQNTNEGAQTHSPIAGGSSSSSQSSVAVATMNANSSSMQQLAAHAAQLPSTIVLLQERLRTFDGQLRSVADVNVSERLAICANKDKLVCTLERLRSKLADSEPQRAKVDAQIHQLESEITAHRRAVKNKMQLQTDRDQIAAQLDEAIHLQAQIQTLLGTNSSLGSLRTADTLTPVHSVLTRSQQPVLLANRIGVAPVPASSAPVLANPSDLLSSRQPVFRPANSTCELQVRGNYEPNAPSVQDYGLPRPLGLATASATSVMPPTYPQHVAGERLRRLHENIYINDQELPMSLASAGPLPQGAYGSAQTAFGQRPLPSTVVLHSMRPPPFGVAPSLTAVQTHIVTTPSPATFYASGQPVGVGQQSAMLGHPASLYDAPRAVAVPLNGRRGLVDADSAISIAEVESRPKVAQLSVRFDYRRREEQLTIRVDCVVNAHVLLHSMHSDADAATDCEQCYSTDGSTLAVTSSDCRSVSSDSSGSSAVARRRYAMCVKAVLIPGVPYINLHTRYVDLPFSDAAMSLGSGSASKTACFAAQSGATRNVPVNSARAAEQPNSVDLGRRSVDFDDVFLLTVPGSELFAKTTHFSFWLQETTVTSHGRAVNTEQCVGYTQFSMSTLLNDEAVEHCQNATLLNVVQLDRLDYGTFPWLPLPHVTTNRSASASAADMNVVFSGKKRARTIDDATSSAACARSDRPIAAAQPLERPAISVSDPVDLAHPKQNQNQHQNPGDVNGINCSNSNLATAPARQHSNSSLESASRDFASSASQTTDTLRQQLSQMQTSALACARVDEPTDAAQNETDANSNSIRRGSKDKQAIISQYLSKVRASSNVTLMQAIASGANDSSRGRCSEEIEECC